MKPIDVKSDSFAEYNEDSNEKVLSLRLVIVLGFQSAKTFLLKIYALNWSEEIFVVNC